MPAAPQGIKDELLSAKNMGICQSLDTRPLIRTGAYVESMLVDGGSGKVTTTGTGGHRTAPEMWQVIMTRLNRAKRHKLLSGLGIASTNPSFACLDLPASLPKDQDLHIHFSPMMENTSMSSAAAAVSVIALLMGYQRRPGVALAAELSVDGQIFQSFEMPHNYVELCISQGITKLLLSWHSDDEFHGEKGLVIERKGILRDCLPDLLMPNPYHAGGEQDADGGEGGQREVGGDHP